MLRGCALGLILSLAWAFPADYEDDQLAACATGNCDDAHGSPLQLGESVDVAGKADGGAFTPGQALTVTNTGGRQYALYATGGGVTQRSDNAPMTVTPTAAGTLTILSVSADGYPNTCVYETLRLTAGDGGTPPPGGGIITPPPDGGGTVTPPPGGGGSSQGVRGNGASGFDDAGQGLFWTTFGSLLLYAVGRQLYALLKLRKQRAQRDQRAQGRAGLAGAPPPPPVAPQAAVPQQAPPWGSPPPSPPPPPSGAPPPPPADEADPTSEWVPQWDAEGRQFFWNTRTNEVQWEPPGLPAAAPAAAAAAKAHVDQTEVDIEIARLPQRRMTLSMPKVHSARRHKFERLAGKRVPYLDVPLLEVALFGLYVGFNALWVTVFAKSSWRLEDQMGYLAAANGLFVVIPAQRTSLWAWIFGLPFDKTITIHRWVGRLTFVEATLHFGLYFRSSSYLTTALLFSTPKYQDGFASWVALAVVFVTSIEWLRRKKYNVFYTLHFSFLLFYIFAWRHTPKFAFYGSWAIGLYATDKLFRMLRSLASRSRVHHMELLPGTDILRVSIPKPWWARPQLGQYIFVNFPAVSKWEWHPYTLASSPLEAHLEVDIKALGDHTKKLLASFQAGQQPQVHFGGPYGRVLINPRRYASIVFVCGGIGVTPMVSMLRWYYLINAPPEVAAKQSVHLAEFIYFLWVVDTASTYDVFRETILQCAARSQKPGFPTFVPLIHVTREGADKASLSASLGLPASAVFSGRPDLRHVLGSVRKNGLPQHAVYCCGPSKLVEQTWTAATELTDERAQFAFHHETFEF